MDHFSHPYNLPQLVHQEHSNSLIIYGWQQLTVACGCVLMCVSVYLASTGGLRAQHCNKTYY